MNAMQQLLVTPQIAADMIRGGATLAIAGDESVLAALPAGHWIGGTIPYFMGQEGGSPHATRSLSHRFPRIPACNRTSNFTTPRPCRKCVWKHPTTDSV